MSNYQSQVKLHPRVRFRSVGQEGVLVNMDTGRVMVISETGLHIVKCLQSPKTPQEIASQVEADFEVGSEDALNDVSQFLSELKNESVIVESDQL